MSTALTRDVGPAAQAGGGQGGVDGPGREDRGHRQPVDRPAGVRDDDDRGAAARRGDGVGREPLERGLQPGRTGVRVPGRIERPDRGPVGPHGRDQPVDVHDDRSLKAHRLRPARRAAQECRPTAELDPQVHDDALALRVDGRVRDLGEGLAEVVGDRSVEAGTAGRRRVVAHAPQRLVRLERHRLDVEPGAFGVEAGEVAQDVVGRRGGRRPGRRCEPVLVRSVAARRGSGTSAGRAPSPRCPRGWPAGPARPAAARPGRAGHGGRSRPR